MLLARLDAIVPLLLATLLYGVNADPSASGGSALYPPGLQPLIQMGNAFLSAGQFNDAVKTYSEAIEQSPADYLLYHRRATAYYSLSRYPAALADFDKVLELTSNSFDKAHLMKARILAKEGRFSEARDAIKKYTSKVRDQDAQEVLFSISEGELAAKKAAQAMKAKLWTACEEAASTAIQTASHSAELRQQRADCALAAGDIQGAVGDLTRLTHLTTPSTSLLMKIFRLSYFLGSYSPLDTQSPALSTLKRCLHYDPDSAQCKPAHRLVKSFDKSFAKLESHLGANDWRAVISLLSGDSGLAATFDDALEKHVSRAALSLPPAIPLPHAKKASPRREAILRALCKAYVKNNEPRKAERWCDALLEMEGRQDDVDGLVGRGEALLVQEDWEEAVRVFQRAFEATGRSDREVHERLQKAQRLLKQSRQKDYYKVLGVSRDADTKTIKKAYRKAAMKAHPDKGGSEAKMAAVNEAYEVLSNPELRQRFDNGDDPNDPMSQQGGHAWPGGAGGAQQFAQFFQQGFQFHFSPPGFHGHGR
ncbi:DnaJ-domain-containing protein [Wolfiporia cocos MD-104 SS10]|uniref:DnaJ-domain-containing protein n=1 Tax=Wolfiporia cocos (strain MD-104) TaxID=742152 RepID=A0A2H3JHX5_WOLCO|nr:DnaJ-domain-containing protein [Wolfiporia cocos MD-104 SS10]